MKKIPDQDTLTLTLIKNPDILATLSQHAQRPDIVVGFAAETHEHLSLAKDKLRAKGCDVLVVNDVSKNSQVLGGDNTHLTILFSHKETVKDLGYLSKTEAAKLLIDTILNGETS
jgi:phosphopantothenoylcysteine decarboxylase/phosphopantothenate--cysteine ligase